MTREMNHDSVHRRLVQLWNKLMMTDHDKAIVHVDRTTWHCLVGSRDAYRDGSVDPLDPLKGESWRRLKVVFQMAPLEFHPLTAELSPAEVAHDPFCMYIEAIKGNGRRVYIDDPETDKRYL